MTLQIHNLGDNLVLARAPGLVQPPARGGVYRSALKRVFDVAVVLAVAPIGLALVGLLALLVALDGAAPFYRGARVGRGGQSFRMLKLRTMVPRADRQLQMHLQRDAAARCEWDCSQKLRDDPRVTRLGRLLRKSSLDELPQLWHVLTGDMSLVGPRPMLPEQRALYPAPPITRCAPASPAPGRSRGATILHSPGARISTANMRRTCRWPPI